MDSSCLSCAAVREFSLVMPTSTEDSSMLRESETGCIFLVLTRYLFFMHYIPGFS